MIKIGDKEKILTDLVKEYKINTIHYYEDVVGFKEQRALMKRLSLSAYKENG